MMSAAGDLSDDVYRYIWDHLELSEIVRMEQLSSHFSRLVTDYLAAAAPVRCPGLLPDRVVCDSGDGNLLPLRQARVRALKHKLRFARRLEQGQVTTQYHLPCTNPALHCAHNNIIAYRLSDCDSRLVCKILPSPENRKNPTLFDEIPSQTIDFKYTTPCPIPPGSRYGCDTVLSNSRSELLCRYTLRHDGKLIHSRDIIYSLMKKSYIEKCIVFPHMEELSGYWEPLGLGENRAYYYTLNCRDSSIMHIFSFDFRSYTTDLVTLRASVILPDVPSPQVCQATFANLANGSELAIITYYGKSSDAQLAFLNPTASVFDCDKGEVIDTLDISQQLYPSNWYVYNNTLYRFSIPIHTDDGLSITISNEYTYNVRSGSFEPQKSQIYATQLNAATIWSLRSNYYLPRILLPDVKLMIMSVLSNHKEVFHALKYEKISPQSEEAKRCKLGVEKAYVELARESCPDPTTIWFNRMPEPDKDDVPCLSFFEYTKRLRSRRPALARSSSETASFHPSPGTISTSIGSYLTLHPYFRETDLDEMTDDMDFSTVRPRLLLI